MGGLLYINLNAQLYNTIEEAALWEQIMCTVPNAIVEACAQRLRIHQAKTKIRAVAQSYNQVMLRYVPSTWALSK